MIFIFPDIGWNSINFSPAILCLSAYLKSHIDIDINVLHLNERHGTPYDLDLICSRVTDYAPDFIGVTSTSYTYEEADAIAGALKVRGVTVPIILGGAHTYTNPDDIETSNFDAFAIGEGELSLLDFCRRLAAGYDVCTTPGFYYKTKSGVSYNPPSEALSNLDEIPARDYDLMNASEMLDKRNGWLNIAFSRGCPYSCSFCINQTQRALFQEKNKCSYFRCQTVDRALSELVAIAERYRGKLKVFNFDDDLLMLRKEWFASFTDGYVKKIYKPYGIRYVINGRADLIDADIVGALAKSGCFELQIGFESGDSDLRNRMLKKQISDDDLLRVFAICREKDVRTLAYTMLGIPGENHETVNRTLVMLCRLKPTLIRLTIFDPFVGTPLHNYCMENSLIKSDRQLQNHFTGSRLVFEGLSDYDIASYHLLFPWYLNISAGNEPDVYRELIKEYASLPYDILIHPDTRAAVIERDARQSERMCQKNISHFRYFGRNPFYYEYWAAQSLTAYSTVSVCV